MRLKLYNKDDIKLPLELDYLERMKFAEKVILDNPESFQITGFDRADNKVKVRLDILATYILNAVEDIREDVMSKYKQNVRPYQEKSISNLPEFARGKYHQMLYSNACVEAKSVS